MNNSYNQTFDTNLVRAFLAIWDTGSLTLASQQLGLTQPALSHALKRLRERFDDPLFVRGPQGMAPTHKASQLHEPFSNAYALIHSAVEQTRRFDPSTSNRRFSIAMSDVSEVYFLPRLLSWLRKSAPGVTIESVPLRAGRIARRMKLGEIDLAIGHIPELEGECISQTLFHDRLICLVRADHAMAGRTLTPQQFAQLRQIDVGATAPSHAVLDAPLARLNLRRNYVLSIHHLLAAPQLVRDSDLATIFPESLAHQINRNAEFSLLPLGLDLPELEVQLHVHKRMAKDKTLGWLMAGLRELCSKPEI
ncbi:LysR family transcriptional regulator [Novosphingobium sp. 1949]|uniref:LysR family transcriptional regulator n=1 Tax=Novosphingobium organovorum TaxID=2930092 RepID=A0ABT0BBT2_9SPHN|nr:LysR family transcriptional regulator [Novosphingobium organovorum]MCJ2182453.1 LysR family transcriptional regulator [Novosphingobium organovorum]